MCWDVSKHSWSTSLDDADCCLLPHEVRSLPLPVLQGPDPVEQLQTGECHVLQRCILGIHWQSNPRAWTSCCSTLTQGTPLQIGEPWSVLIWRLISQARVLQCDVCFQEIPCQGNLGTCAHRASEALSYKALGIPLQEKKMAGQRQNLFSAKMTKAWFLAQNLHFLLFCFVFICFFWDTITIIWSNLLKKNQAYSHCNKLTVAGNATIFPDKKFE